MKRPPFVSRNTHPTQVHPTHVHLMRHTRIAMCVVLAVAYAGYAVAQERESKDGWVHQRDDATSLEVHTKELIIHPKAEPKPSLKYRLIPDPFDAVRGNAALFYLKASGFLEQDAARKKVIQFREDATAKAREQGTPYHLGPPYNWLSIPPENLPLDEVKAYLRLHSFQPKFLQEGAQRSHFDMDRNFRDVEDPIAYLLPEIQGLREVARVQSMRCRVAIAEGRIDDAIAITGQQFAMARHLGQDDFLVSNLVGIAISTIAWNDAMHLVEHPKTPNLYWALAAMPTPLVNMQHAMSIERQFLYQQLKVMREVDETPRPAGYWETFIDRLVGQMGMLAGEFNINWRTGGGPKDRRAAVIAYVIAAYPGAKAYLIDVQKMPRKQVEDYPTAQVVFLAVVRFHNHWRDEFFKWTHVPYWQSKEAVTFQAGMRVEAEKYGWLAIPTETLLPAVVAARTAEARCSQSIALLQTVEALRMHAAAHDGKLPASLDDLAVPAPIEPFTGKPIDFQPLGDRAVLLNGHALPGMRYRLIVRVAK